MEKNQSHMTPSIKTDENRSPMTEKMLNLTLEIICLLTGESFPLLKSGDHVTITVPPCDSQIPEIPNMEKVLEVTKKMMELLTGEVPIRSQDVTVYFSMEEWEYLEGHKDLYKDIMMEDQPPLTSPDGSRKRNPPETCPRPLDSQDSTPEDHTYAKCYQNEELKGIKVEVKDEEEEMLVSGVLQSMEEREMMMKSEQEEFSLHVNTNGQHIHNTFKEHLIITSDNIDITQHSPGVNPIIHNHRYHRPSHAGTSIDPSHPDDSADNFFHDTKTPTEPSNLESLSNEGEHTVKSSMSCLVCGNVTHFRYEKSNDIERPYSCPECRKCFIQKRNLLNHQRTHTGERPYSCSDCGRSFIHQVSLFKHKRTHMGERPYLCPECGKGFFQPEDLLRHKKIHTGERPFTCSECNKRFSEKANLIVHQRTHTNERPFSCSECGKSFTQKSALQRHQNIHTGRKFSCSECGKCCSQKGNLIRHQRSHTGLHPFSCSECGKGFAEKKSLQRHQKIHTGKKNVSLTSPCPYETF